MEVVKLLLQAGADPAGRDGMLFTAMHCACGKGHVATARVLIDAGADAHAPNKDGWTPLMQAALEGRVRAMELLIEEGVDVDARLPSGNTALMLAARKHHTEAVRVLIDAGADVNAVDGKGVSALVRACREPVVDHEPGNQTILEILRAPKLIMTEEVARRAIEHVSYFTNRNWKIVERSLHLLADQLRGVDGEVSALAWDVWCESFPCEWVDSMSMVPVWIALHGSLRWQPDYNCAPENMAWVEGLFPWRLPHLKEWVKAIRYFATQAAGELNLPPGLMDAVAKDPMVLRHVGVQSQHLNAEVVEMAESGNGVMQCAVHAGGVGRAMAVARAVVEMFEAEKEGVLRFWNEGMSYSITRAFASSEDTPYETRAEGKEGEPRGEAPAGGREGERKA